MYKKPYVLMILDGWGIGEKNSNNAIFQANTPNLDKLSVEYPSAKLNCFGASVGLPNGIMGNSEVGHLNIGAGRVVYQDLLRIDKAIEDQSFYQNPVLKKTLDKVISCTTSLHLMGLLSDGGVHSQISHLYALLDLAKKKGIRQTFVHVILDGRDTPPNNGIKYVAKLKAHLDKIGIGSISTICGRYYAMDRDQRWDRVKKAYELYTQGIGLIELDPIEAVKKAYLRGETDEFIKPIIFKKNISIKNLINDKDVVIFFNFRADRAREISSVFTEPKFNKFNRNLFPNLSQFLSMTMYDKNFKFPNIFPPIKIKNLLGEVLSNNKLNQLRIAETEKYAHVTYFFNGGKESPFPNEERCLIPSPRDVDTYDKKPEMSALTVTEETIKQVKSGKYDFIVINLANMDMVGHTGSFDAAVKACEVVDKCVQKIINEILSKNGVVVLTADHGNSEKMSDSQGNPFTAHTKNKVPLLIISKEFQGKAIRTIGTLSDIAPTLLDIMGIKKPKDMTGISLLNP